MGRVLNRLNEKIDLDLYYIEGGSKPNAIPRYTRVKVTIPKGEYEKAKSIILDLDKELKNEFLHSDKDVEVMLNKLNEDANKVFSGNTKERLITAINLLPNGVQSMSMAIEGLVESSNNLGVIKTLEDHITLESAIRSSVGTLKQFISQIGLLAKTLLPAMKGHLPSCLAI